MESVFVRVTRLLREYLTNIWKNDILVSEVIIIKKDIGIPPTMTKLYG